MKKAPPFNEEKARKEVLSYFRSLAPSMKDTLYEDLSIGDKRFFEQCVVYKKRNWPHEWALKQIQEGGQLLEEMLSKLSKDERELIEDYLENKLDEVCASEASKNDPNY